MSNRHFLVKYKYLVFIIRYNFYFCLIIIFHALFILNSAVAAIFDNNLCARPLWKRVYNLYAQMTFFRAIECNLLSTGHQSIWYSIIRHKHKIKQKCFKIHRAHTETLNKNEIFKETTLSDFWSRVFSVNSSHQFSNNNYR